MNRIKTELAETLSVTAPLPIGPPSPEYLTAEKHGNLIVLKCRTPGEAFLVAEELEAADIIASVPDEAAMEQEFQVNGFVSIRVSASSYDRASELKSVIERAHWDVRAEEPLSILMALIGLGLGLFIFPGNLCYLMVRDGYRKRGFTRKERTFRRCFRIGCICFFLLIVTFASKL